MISIQAADYGIFLVSGRRYEGAKTVPKESTEAIGTGFCQLPSRSLGAAATTIRFQDSVLQVLFLGGCPRPRTRCSRVFWDQGFLP